MENNITNFDVVPFIRECAIAQRSPFTIAQRRLLDYLFFWVQEGECLIRVEGEILELKAGDYILIQPNSLHELEGKTNTITPFIHFDLFYNPRRGSSFIVGPGITELSDYGHLIQPRLNDVMFHIPTVISLLNPKRISELLIKMIVLWQSGEVLSRLEARAQLFEIVLHILKQYQPLEMNQPVKSLDWIDSYLTFHISEPLNVDEMAQRAHLSPSRFNVVFQKQFSVPPYRYFLLFRINHAKELLKTTSLTHEKIAEYCGFNNVHHFASTFKRFTSETPGQYRNHFHSV